MTGLTGSKRRMVPPQPLDRCPVRKGNTISPLRGGKGHSPIHPSGPSLPCLLAAAQTQMRVSNQLTSDGIRVSRNLPEVQKEVPCSAAKVSSAWMQRARWRTDTDPFRLTDARLSVRRSASHTYYTVDGYHSRLGAFETRRRPCWGPAAPALRCPALRGNKRETRTSPEALLCAQHPWTKQPSHPVVAPVVSRGGTVARFRKEPDEPRRRAAGSSP